MTFYSVFTSLLIVALTAMICYDIYVFFKMKVHKTYSSSCLLMASVTLLLFRIAILTLFLVQETPTAEETTFVGDLLGDIPMFLINFIIMCLIYQWMQIGELLTSPIEAIKNAESG